MWDLLQGPLFGERQESIATETDYILHIVPNLSQINGRISG